MSLSADISGIAAYLAYVQDYGDELISRAFFSPKTVMLSAAAGAVHEGVKGRKTLTRLKAATGKAVSWSSSFSAASNAVSYEPRHLDVEPIKRDLSFVPQEFEATYLGRARAKGQNPGEDLPYAQYVLETILSGHAEELESALWQAVKAGTVTPGTTAMAACFDGFLEQIADAITATTITAFTTPGGSLTTSNIVGVLESMWNLLGAGYKEGEVNVYLSWANYQKYMQNYRADFGKYVSDNKSAAVTLDFSQNARLFPMAGMGTSNRIVMTPAKNLVIGFDDFNEASLFQMEKNKRVIDFWMDFTVGCTFAQLDEGALVVNDLA